MNAADALMVKIRELLPTVDGWCTPDKAKHLVDAILERKPQLCVEIGVFGGSSLLPQAMALQSLGGGVIHGIDPWSTEAALEEMLGQENKDWWQKVDLEKIYQNCLKHVAKLKLDRHVNLIRAKAADVVGQFEDETVDILHIDGNHSEALSYQDATLYLPKVKRGGLIFFDDIWWADGTTSVTTRKAIMFLLQSCTRLGLVGDCMMLQKG